MTEGGSLLGVLESFDSMLPVEGCGLDSDSRGGYSLYGHGTVFRLDPLGSRRPVGQEEEEADTENHGDSAQDVEDQLVQVSRKVR
jgi:hypothetical protein